MASWDKYVDVIILFTEDLRRSTTFYQDVLGLSVDRQNEESVSFGVGETIIILLDASSARDVIAPAKLACYQAGSRFQITIGVDDVDAVCAQLAARGVELVNGPLGRPWGTRSACFADPASHLWEVAQDLCRAGLADKAVEPSTWASADKRITAVTLFVDDLKRARSFYVDSLGVPVEKESPQPPVPPVREYDHDSARRSRRARTLLSRTGGE
jgi:lactoylglutathione lyase